MRRRQPKRIGETLHFTNANKGDAMFGIKPFDLILVLGVVVLGVLLSIEHKKKYKTEALDFFFDTFYIACVAAVLVGLYHLLTQL
jgi:hypothetical protein